ncbi:uncharacterized protein RJT20DRAFT_92194 [Scheffersomyces xylosifermentans]|uniref:uncharacterized protein n=1 Tax=Scheffersomyces xylosifermentans TaxID=1304137 RepID=UPI00315D0E0F
MIEATGGSIDIEESFKAVEIDSTSIQSNQQVILDTTEIPKILLPLISRNGQPEVLIFNVEDIKRLRDKYGILGILIGTLAQYPQQNFFLSVPLKLFIWEVIWLVESGYAQLIDQVNYRLDKAKELQSKGKLQNNNVIVMTKKDPNSKSASQLESREANFIVTPNTDSHKYSKDYRTICADDYEVSLKDYLKSYIESTSLSQNQVRSYYQNFKYLKKQGFFINPGLKFGGDLVLYPGDPLRFHSYSIVKFNMVDLQDFVVGGRLATSVKKNIVIIGDVDESEEDGSTEEVNDEFIQSLAKEPKKMSFSIEWSGFG